MSRLYGPVHRSLQDRFDTRRLADNVETRVVLTEIPPEHKAFIESRDMFFLSTIDHQGRPTVSYKGGDPGLLVALTSANGTKRTCRDRTRMSAFGAKADNKCSTRAFPLMTQSRHSAHLPLRSSKRLITSSTAPLACASARRSWPARRGGRSIRCRCDRRPGNISGAPSRRQVIRPQLADDRVSSLVRRCEFGGSRVDSALASLTVTGGQSVISECDRR